MIVCYGARHVYGTVLPGIGHSRIVRGHEIAEYILLQTYKAGFPWGKSGTGTLFARTALLRLFPFDEAFRRYEDADFIVRIALAGGTAVSVAEPVLIQHITRDEMGKGTTIDLIYAQMLTRKYKTYLGRAYRSAVWLNRAEFLQRKSRPKTARLIRTLAYLAAARRVLLTKILRQIKNKRR